MTEPELDRLARHEGFRQKIYLCSAGARTVGNGYNLDANPLNLPHSQLRFIETHGVTRQYAWQLMVRVVNDLEKALAKALPWVTKLDTKRHAILVNMAYNMGIPRLLKFKKTLAHIEAGQYDAAAGEMLRSKWAKQVKGRAVELAGLMRNHPAQ